MLGERGEQRGSSYGWLRLVAVGLAIALVAGGSYTYMRSQGPGGAAPDYATAPVTRADVAITVSATGPIDAATASPLSFKNSGKIAQILVHPGDQVRAGRVIATQDSTDLQGALDQAQAALVQAQANLASLAAGATPGQREVAEAAVKSAKTGAADATASLHGARTNADGDVALAQTGVSSAETNLSTTRVALVSAQDQEVKALAADQTAVTTAQKSMAVVRDAVAANVKVLQQQLEKARNDLWSTQTNRDGVCGQSKGYQCGAANAAVASAQSSVDVAAAQLTQGQKQGAEQVAQAQAQLDQAQGQLANDKAKGDTAVASAQSQVKQAQDALAVAKLTFANAPARAAVAVQAAQAQADQAAGTLTSAQATYDQVVAPPAPSALDAAKAQVASARAAVEVAHNNLDSATLRAPFDGTIAAVNGAVGQWVAAGTGGTSGTTGAGLLELLDLQHLVVVSQVNEADMARLDVGNPVDFTLNAFPGQTFTGKVVGIQPRGASQQNVVLYTVTCAVDPTSTRLLPGMTASVAITVASRKDVIVVPAAAISPGQSGGPAAAPPSASNSASVLVFANGKAVPTRIQVGLSDGHVTEVTSGLQVGQAVVTGAAPSS